MRVGRRRTGKEETNKRKLGCLLVLFFLFALVFSAFMFITSTVHIGLFDPKFLRIEKPSAGVKTISTAEELKGDIEKLLASIRKSQFRLDEIKRLRLGFTPNVTSHDGSKIAVESLMSGKSMRDVEQSTISLPLLKAVNHKILGLSDKSFRSLSISEMMSWYGEAGGGGTCSVDFGNELVRSWRSKKKNNCRADPSITGQSSLGQSSIECYLTHQTRHHGTGDNLCVMRNVSVNFGLYGDDSKTRTVVQHYVDTRHADQPYIKFPRGFVQGNCVPNEFEWVTESMPGWNAHWTVDAFQRVSSQADSSEIVCDEWIDHPVLIIQRDTFANFFHDSEDFINAFLAFAILKWNFNNAQIYLTDLYPRGPFWDIWARAFSGSYPTLDSWDIRERFGTAGSGKNIRGLKHRVCFRELAVSIYGPAAPITVASWDTPCVGTALVKAYSDFIIRGLGLQGLTHYASPAPSRIVTVTYLARRSSSVWPEKKYCDDNKSFFLCRYWADWGIRSLGRTVRNDNELVAKLQGLQKVVYSNGATVRFQDVDFNLLSFEDQIKVDLQTDVLVGPHGAGLMHNIFMRDRAVLIELSVDASGGLRHFHNLAHWYGRKYFGLSTSNPIDADELFHHIVQAVNGIELDAY